MPIQNIILTGERNVGKTFMVKRIIQYFFAKRMAGFFTKKNDNGTVTFKPWDNYFLFDSGPEMVLYDVNDRYVRKNVFDELGVWAVNQAITHADLFVCDELGRFESTSISFTESVYKALDSNIVVLAVVKAEMNPFLDRIRKRNDIEMVNIFSRNRDLLYKEVIVKLNKLLDKK